MLAGRCSSPAHGGPLRLRGCGWTSPAQGCTRHRALASAPCLTGRKSIFRISEVPGCKPTSMPPSPVCPVTVSGAGAGSGPDHQLEPCPLTPGPQPAVAVVRTGPRLRSLWVSRTRPGLPCRSAENAAPRSTTQVIPSDFVFSAGSCEHQATEPRLH